MDAGIFTDDNESNWNMEIPMIVRPLANTALVR